MIFQGLIGQRKIVVKVVKNTNHRLVIDPSFFTLNTLFGVLSWPIGSASASHQCGLGSIPGWRSDPAP